MPASVTMSNTTSDSSESNIPSDIVDDLVSLSSVLTKNVDGASGHVDKENGKNESDPSGTTSGKENIEPLGEGLDEEALEILGVNPAQGQQKEVQLNSAIRSRWKYWIRNVLTAEEKEQLIAKYPRKGECNLEAPLLNPEVTGSLTETTKNRDKYFAAAYRIHWVLQWLRWD